MAPDERKRQPTAIGFFVAAAAFVVIVAGIRAAESVIVPFLLAAFIAIISSPPLYWLKRKGVPMGLAMILVILGILTISLLVVALVGTSLHDFSQALPLYQERLHVGTDVLVSWLKKRGVTISDKTLIEYIDPGAAMGFASTILTGLGSVLSNGFLILLTVIFILLETSSFPGKLHSAVSDPDASLGNFDAFVNKVNRYMAIKTWLSLATGIAIAIWLALLGIDYPLLWGLLAFLLNYVPNIGSIIAAVPAVLLAWVQLGFGSALLATVGFVVVNIGVGNIVEPQFMGRGLGLSSLVVFVSLVFWGWVLGPVGMLLSVPLTMTVKIALDSREDTKWIAVLLDSESSAGNG